MPYFKNANNDLFWLDAEETNPKKWLKDCVAISDEEAEVMKEAKHQEWLAKQPSKAQVIAKLEEQLNILKSEV